MPIDLSGVPDSKLNIDLSGVPDKNPSIDLSGVPDKTALLSSPPDKETSPQTVLGADPESGTWGAFYNSIKRVYPAVAGSFIAFPASGVAGFAKYVSSGGDLNEAMKTITEIQELPQKLLKTPEEFKSVEMVSKVFKPIEMSGEGWRLIAEAGEKGVANLRGVEHKPTIAQPLAGIMGEVSAMGAMGGETLKFAKGKGQTAIKGLSAKNLEKLRVAQESKNGRYGVIPEQALVTEVKGKPVVIPKIVTAEKTGLNAKDLVAERRANIDKGILDSEIFIKQFERELSPLELDAIPFIREGMKDPSVLRDIGRQDLIPLVENPSNKLKAAAKKAGKYYDDSFQFLKENWADVSFVEDYVTHVWDIPKGRRSEIVNSFATKNPFLKKRTIPTLEEGLKMGLKPKTTNIAELLRIYDQYKVKTAFNHRFANDLKGLKGEDGNPLIMRGDKAPVDWVEVNHTALNRAMAVGKIGKEGIMLQKVPVKVHPDIAKEIKIVFDKPFSHGAITAMETVNAFTKKTMLSASFFHHWALTEAAFSSGIGKKALSMWNPWKIAKSLKNKDYAIFKEQTLAKDAIDHGVTFGALEDIQRGVIHNALKNAERFGERVNLPTAPKMIRKANDLWDAGLWDYYHNSLKMWAYEQNVFDALKSAEKDIGRPPTPTEITAIKREMGKFTNDSFGGQNWDLNAVTGNPKVRQMMHWVLLAPDWTISVAKQAMAPARGAYKSRQGYKKAPTVEGQLAEKMAGKALTKQGATFWARAALYYELITQSVNYYNTQKEYGEGRFTWDNPPGKKFDVFWGRNEDGTERYVRTGKQFREPLEWIEDPLEKLGAKFSPVLQEAWRQKSGTSPGGYPTAWKDLDFWSKKGAVERAKSIAEMPLPFSLRPYVEDRPKNFMFAFPSSKGMTPYRAVDEFKKALNNEDVNRVRETMIHALRNNLDGLRHLQTAQSSIKSDITFDYKDIARDILAELNRVEPEDREAVIDTYTKQGVLIPEVATQLGLLIQSAEGIAKQQKAFGVNIQSQQGTTQ